MPTMPMMTPAVIFRLLLVSINFFSGWNLSKCENKSQINLTREIQSKSDNELDASFNSKGVVKFINNGKNEKASFEILNLDGSVFASVSLASSRINISGRSFKLSDYDQNKELIKDKFSFDPEVFSIESGNVIVFQYVRVNGPNVEIYINKDKKLIKTIKLNAKLFKIESWNNHMIGALIDFNIRKNSIFDNPNEKSRKIAIDNDEVTFVIDELKGDWVRIECLNFCDIQCPKNKTYSGWLRWRIGKRLIIRFVYSC